MLQKKEDTREYCTLRFLRHLDGCPAYAASEEYFLFNAHPCQSPQCCCAKYGRSHALCDPKLLPTPRSILAVVPDRVDHSLGNEVLLQNKPCYQRGSPCQDPAGYWTTRRPPDHRKETQTAVGWSCFPFIRSGQTHLARYSERGKKTRKTEEEVGRQHQGMDRHGVRQVPEGSGEQGKMEKTVCKIICGAPTTLAVKGLKMMIQP